MQVADLMQSLGASRQHAEVALHGLGDGVEPAPQVAGREGVVTRRAPFSEHLGYLAAADDLAVECVNRQVVGNHRLQVP